MPVVVETDRDELIWQRCTRAVAKALSIRGRTPFSGTGVGGVTDTGLAQIYLSKTTYVHGAAGTVVGNVSVRAGSVQGPYTCTLQGTDASKFAIDATNGNLITVGTIAAGTYAIDIVISSPASLAPSKRSFTITAT